MSRAEHERDGLLLRRGEWDLLEAARRGEELPAEQVTAVIERLGRTRKARLDDPNFRQQADDLRAELAALRALRKRDLRAFEREGRRLRRERDDLRQAVQEETSRRMVISRRAGEL